MDMQCDNTRNVLHTLKRRPICANQSEFVEPSVWANTARLRNQKNSGTRTHKRRVKVAGGLL